MIKVKVSWLLWWILVPLLNFYLCFHIGSFSTNDLVSICSTTSVATSSQSAMMTKPCRKQASPTNHTHAPPNMHLDDSFDPRPATLEEGPTLEFHKDRRAHMADMRMVGSTFKVKPSPQSTCSRFITTWSAEANKALEPGEEKQTCFAVVHSKDITANRSMQLVRFKDPPKVEHADEPGADGHGFFTKVPTRRHRRNTNLKMKSFFHHFHEITDYVSETLKKAGLMPGSDVVVMVVNKTGILV